MRECKVVILASVCILINFVFGSVSTVLAEESTEKEISVGLNADFLSQYIWRGQQLNKDWVFQPSVDIGYESLSASIWGNLDLTKDNDQRGEFSEIDYILEQSDAVPAIGDFEIKGLNYSVGAIYYASHQHDSSDMTEVFWGFGLDYQLSPSIKIYHDAGQPKRTYVVFSLEYSYEKIAEISGAPVGMDVSAGLGWGSNHYNNYYWGSEELSLNSSLNDFSLSVAFPIEIADGWTFTPGVNYISLVDKDIRKSDAYSTKSDLVVAALSLSKQF